MKKIFIFLVVLNHLTFGAYSQISKSSVFENELQGESAYVNTFKTYGKGNDIKLNRLFLNDSITWNAVTVSIDVLQKDSFYYVLGSYPNNQFLTKFDMQGNIIKQKTNAFIDEPYSMYYHTSNKLIELSDGNMAYLYAELHADTNYLTGGHRPVIKYFDNNLNVIKSYYWNDTIGFYPTGGLVADKNNGFTYCGQLVSRSMTWIQHDSVYGYFRPDSIYIGIVQVDSNLNVLYKNKKYLNHPNCISENRITEDLEKSHEGGYIVGGHVNACGGVANWAGYSAFIMKFDSLLNYQWVKIFEDSIASDDSNPINIVTSKFGGYIYTREHTKTQSIAYGKFDENGNILWEKYFNKTLDTNGLAGVLTINSSPNGVIEKDNGDIIFGSRINWNRATGLVRTDSLGNVKWSRVISTNYQDSLLYYSYVFNVKNPIGEGALLVGRVHTMGAFLIRTDSMGCTLPNCLDTTLHVGLEEIIEMRNQSLIVYPNPTQDKLQIAINQQGEKVEKVVIFDINGREVLNKTFSEYLVDLNVNSLNKGIYMIKVIGNTGGVFNSKFIKE
jgi:hypothetical protein